MDALSPLMQDPGRLYANATAVTRPLPAAMGECFVIPGFLSAEECRLLVASAETLGFRGADSDYPPSYRNMDRLVRDDDALAARLFARLRAHVPIDLSHGEGDDKSTWRIAALNSRIRWCRYRAGQQFSIHRDGVRYESEARRSFYTFMIYLTDGDAFTGGDTLFFAGGPGSGSGGSEPGVVARVRPRAGMLIVFDHALWHSGDALVDGVKHILRSDILYERVNAAPSALREEPHSDRHAGYIWTLAGLSGGGFASGGRDTRVRLWSGDAKAIRELSGHSQSVLGLAQTGNGVLASVSRDRDLRFWNVDTGACLHAVKAHDVAVLSIAALSDDRIATGGADGRIALWDADARLLHRWHAHGGWVWALATVDDHCLASASEAGTLTMWDVTTAQPIATVTHDTAWRSLDVVREAPGQKTFIAAGDIAGNTHLYAVEGRALEHIATWHTHDAAVRRVRFLSAHVLATTGEDCSMRVWLWREQRMTLQHRQSDFVTDVLALSPDSLVACGYEGELRIVARHDPALPTAAGLL